MNSDRRANVAPRSHISASAIAAESHSTDALLTSFRDVDTYQRMCAVFLQLLRDSQLDPQAVSSLQRRLYRLKNIDDQITVGGNLQPKDALPVETSVSQPLAHCSNVALRRLISTVESTLQSTRQFEEKREYIEAAMKRLLLEVPRTALDAHTLPSTKVQRFRSQFPRKRRSVEQQITNEISLQRLRQELPEIDKPSPTDYLLTARLLKTCFGHGAMEQDLSFSQIFNVIFDKSGKLIVSADEEGLIKLWSAETGLLLWSLKGHASFMEELMITDSNKYLVSCGNDGIRIWSLSTRICLAVIYCQACVFSITSYTNENKEEVICFADHNTFYQLSEPEFLNLNGRCISLTDILVSHTIPKISQEPSNFVCEVDISPQGYPIVGLESGEIIVFDKSLLSRIKPETIPYLHSRQHSKKCVEIKWNKQGTSFASCSLDGTCRIWEISPTAFAEGSLRSLDQLRMPKNQKRRNKRKEYLCSTVGWSCQSTYLLAAFAECKDAEDSHGEGDMVVYDAARMTVLHEVRSKLPYAMESVNVLQTHPFHDNIAMFCEGSGRIVLLDIKQCSLLAVLSSKGFHLGHPNFNVELVEGKWSPNGNIFVTSSEYGNITIYGYGPKEPYRISPTEQFYYSDNEVFIYDSNRTPLTLDGQIDINSIDRGPVCNVNKVPYSFRYTNDLQDLAGQGYFSQEIKHQLLVDAQCYNVPDKWVTCLQEQNLESQSQEEVYKISTLSLSESELYDYRRLTEARLNEILNKKILEYNSFGRDRLIQSEERLIMMEEPAALNKKSNKFKKLRRDAISSSEEEEYKFDQVPSEDEPSASSQEVIKKRRRPRYNPTQEEPRARRSLDEFQELEEEYNENERRNRRRKMLHRLEDDEDVYVAAPRSDSKKESNHEQFGQMCRRCEIERSYKICQGCEVGYCENCHEYRGRGEDYMCFECLVKANRGEEERSVIREPYERLTRDGNYVPQLGDSVYFFFQGYEELLVRYYDCFNNKIAQMVDHFRLIEFDEHQFLRLNPECVVRRVQYMFPIKSRERADRLHEQQSRHNLLTVLQLEAVGKNLLFYVYYIVGGVDFLVRKEIMREVEDKKILYSIKVNDVRSAGNTDIQIIEKGPLEDAFAQSTWKYLLVHDCNERLRRNHTKHDRRLSVWQLDEIPFVPFERIPDDLAKKILANIQQLKHAQPELVELFVHDVDTRQYKTYNSFVEVSICLERIEKRLRNGYYRSIESLKFDGDLIVRNSEIFNGTDHDVTLTAAILRDELFKIIESGGNSVYSVSESKSKQQPPQPQPQAIAIQQQQPMGPRRARLRENRKHFDESDSFDSALMQVQDEDFSPNQDMYSSNERRVTRSRRQPASRNERPEQRQGRRLTRRTMYPE